MLKPLSCLLVAMVAVRADGPEWSELDKAENVFDQRSYSNNYRTSEKMYPQLPNSNSITQLDFKDDTYESSNCDAIYNCGSCTEVQLCRPKQNGLYVPYMTLTCPWDTPYCDPNTGTCSIMADESCGSPDQFICPSEGYFPDAMNCTIYHVCRNYESNAYLCGSGIYDPDQKSCVLKGTCIEVDCSDKIGMKVSLGSSHYYATCITENLAQVNRCIGDYHFNTGSQKCEPICTQTGLIQDYFNCTQYYRCSVISESEGRSRLSLQHLPCPNGFGFDKTSMMCLPLYETDCDDSALLEESIS